MIVGRGVTSATVTSTTARALVLAHRFRADVESMEGFAVLRAAQLAGVPGDRDSRRVEPRRRARHQRMGLPRRRRGRRRDDRRPARRSPLGVMTEQNQPRRTRSRTRRAPTTRTSSRRSPTACSTARRRSRSCSTTSRRSTVAAREGRFALTKVSYGAIPYLLDQYRILRAGGALGRGCGPLVVARPGVDAKAPLLTDFAEDATFAIPGRMHDRVRAAAPGARARAARSSRCASTASSTPSRTKRSPPG